MNGPASMTAIVLFAFVSAAVDQPQSQTASEAPTVEQTDAQIRSLRQDVARLQAQRDELRRELGELRAQRGRQEIPLFWLVLGFVGQVIFGLRFVVQWIVTEIKKRSIVPIAFWYLSLAGSVVLLSYAIYRVDPVFIAGFSLNMIIYLRNLYFIHLHPGRSAGWNGRPTGSQPRND